MSENNENIGKNSNKITVLNISGKKHDRECFEEHIKRWYETIDYSKKDFSKCSSRQIIRKIQGCMLNKFGFYPEVIIFENLNSDVIQDIGNEIENMVLDIRLNKMNKFIKNEQIKSYSKLLEKLCYQNNWKG